MGFQAKMYVDDDTATASIRLVGDLDSASAPKLNELISQAAAVPGKVRRLVLLMERLNYLSSAGLRCLVFAHQKMPGLEIVLIGARSEVAETIRLTGLDRAVTLQDPADV
jgi:anti-sigma B factor antagonist